jgi:hypothetical protein
MSKNAARILRPANIGRAAVKKGLAQVIWTCENSGKNDRVIFFVGCVQRLNLFVGKICQLWSI